MSMREHFCEELDLLIFIPMEIFEKDRLLDEIKNSPESTGLELASEDFFVLFYGGRNNPEDEHAHIAINFRGDRVRLRITYHSSANQQTEGERPVFLEDCAQWLGSFIKDDVVKGKLDASFRLGENYFPVFSLPFPLLTSKSALAGAMVTGLKIRLPQRNLFRNIVVQKINKGTGVHVDTFTTFNLKTFDPHKQVEEIFAQIIQLFTNTGEK